MKYALRGIPPGVHHRPLPQVLHTHCIAGGPDGIFEGGGIDLIQHHTLHAAKLAACTDSFRSTCRYRSRSAVYFAVSVALGAAVASLAVVFRLNRYFLLFLAVMFYPYVLQLVPRNSSSGNLIGLPAPQHLTLLFLPALLLACAAILSAVIPRRPARWPHQDQRNPGRLEAARVDRAKRQAPA